MVSSALELLTVDGADALSLRAVARRAGVSPMAPYRHYADKEHLLAAVAAHGFDGLRNILTEADRTCSAGDRLTSQAVAYVRYALENPALFRLMFGPVRVAPHEELRVASEAAYDVLASRVAAEFGGSAGQEARVLGCWSLVHGLALLFLDGWVGAKTAAPADEVTRAVALAMMDTGNAVAD